MRNVFGWLIVVVVSLALAFSVVTRPKPVVHQAPPAVVEVVVPKPAPVAEPAHRAPDKPAPKAEQPKAAVVTKHARPRAAKPRRVTVAPDSGGAQVSVSCATVKGYVEKFGRERVITGAQNYGYTAQDAEKTLSGCGL